MSVIFHIYLDIIVRIMFGEENENPRDVEPLLHNPYAATRLLKLYFILNLFSL
jgi:hypothetical protein